jgi:hypothetical protein
MKEEEVVKYALKQERRVRQLDSLSTQQAARLALLGRVVL